MGEAISNTSPLLYLYRAGILDWLPRVFDAVWVPDAVLRELDLGLDVGYDVPAVRKEPWLSVVNPTSTPSHWLALDLGPGELAAMALALEYPSHVLLLDDRLARRTAAAAGLQVWGTLRVLLEGKALGFAPQVAPLIDRLAGAGLWISAEVRRRVLDVAGE